MAQLENNIKKRKPTVLWIVAILLLLSVAFGTWFLLTPHTASKKETVQKDDYTCPMHQQVHSEKPGDCPICAMKLVKRSTLHNAVGQSQDTSSEIRNGVMLSSLSAIKANVSTTLVTMRLLRNELRFPGMIEIAEPNERIITARTRGRIERLYVNETGAYIKVGMPLYEYYSPDLSNDVAQYIIAKNVRMHAVMDQGQGHSHLDLEHISREKLKLYGLSERQIDEYANKTEAPQSFTIYAPASGTVIKKNILEGAWSDEGTMLFQIAELSTVWATFDIPQDALASVRIGQIVSVTASAYQGREFSGRVIFISPVLNETTRTARIRIVLANPASKLKIQMAVEGHITVASENTLAIPASAVVHNGDENIVWVKRSDGMFYPQTVTLGFRDAEDYYVVVSGIEKGDEIATSGTFLIDSEHQLKSNSLSMPGMDMKKENSKEQKSPSQDMKNMKM